MRGHWKLFAAAVFLSVYPAQLRADIAPHPFVQEMCEDAELIVEGLYTGGDRVAVAKVWKAPDGFAETTLTIDHLPAYDKAVGEYRKFPEQVDADGVVLFLKRLEGRWVPLHEAKQDRGYAAPGVLWFNERRCYGFERGMIGGYALVRGDVEREGPRVPKNIEALTTEIAQGLRMAREWREIRDLPPHVRAAVLAKYLSPRTRPAGYHAHGDRLLMRRVLDAGVDALPHLIDALDHAAPDDSMNEALHILYEYRAEARPAIPAMLGLLDRPGATSRLVIVYALEGTDDPAIVPPLRTLLNDPDREVSRAAATSLGRLNDRESFAAIAALLPNPPQENDAHLVLDLLNALHVLDPARTRPLVERARSDPQMYNVHHQLPKDESP